jgi:hypothetical protein
MRIRISRASSSWTVWSWAISDLSTTLGIYGHRDDSDLETAMEAYAQWLEDEAPSVPSEEGS